MHAANQSEPATKPHTGGSVEGDDPAVLRAGDDGVHRGVEDGLQMARLLVELGVQPLHLREIAHDTNKMPLVVRLVLHLTQRQRHGEGAAVLSPAHQLQKKTT